MSPFTVRSSRFPLLVVLAAAWLALAAASGCAPTGVYHTIEPGQTLYRIARTYDIPERELARINKVRDPTRLQVGDKLYIPGATRLREVSSSSAASASPSPSRQAPAAVRAPEKPATAKAPQPRSAPAQPPPKKPAPAAASSPGGKPEFLWPTKGRVIKQFGTSKGAATKGIEISCNGGDAIHAAAPGKVIYSGNGIRGYGHLVIVEHADDYFTVYGYNRKNLAKTNDYVSQGDRIALCGQPPSAGSSRLHFEVRKGKQAVNPIFYLP